MVPLPPSANGFVEPNEAPSRFELLLHSTTRFLTKEYVFGRAAATCVFCTYLTLIALCCVGNGS